MNRLQRCSSLVACLCAALAGSGCGDSGTGPAWEPNTGAGEPALDREVARDTNQPAILDQDSPFASNEPTTESEGAGTTLASVPARCTELCQRLEAAGCGDSDCAAECAGDANEPCFAEVLAAYECMTRSPGFSCVDGNINAESVVGCRAEAEAADLCDEAEEESEPAPTN